MFTLGNNAYGQCGRKINPQEEYKGSMVSHNIKHLGKETIKSVCCGQDHRYVFFLNLCTPMQ